MPLHTSSRWCPSLCMECSVSSTNVFMQSSWYGNSPLPVFSNRSISTSNRAGCWHKSHSSDLIDPLGYRQSSWKEYFKATWPSVRPEGGRKTLGSVSFRCHQSGKMSLSVWWLNPLVIGFQSQDGNPETTPRTAQHTGIKRQVATR